MIFTLDYSIEFKARFAFKANSFDMFVCVCVINEKALERFEYNVQ